MSPPRDLVTGAAGLIGFELTRQLLAAGREVIAIDSFRKGGREDLDALVRASNGRLRALELDLAQPGALDAVGGPVDTLYHLAAIVGVAYVDAHPYETMAVNMRGTLAALDWALPAGSCRAVVFASSSENYASGVDRGWVPLPTPEDVPLTIADSALPRWSYAASKTAGESAVFGAARLGGFTPLVIRFHNVYGARMGLTHVVPEFVDRARRRLDPFPVYGHDATRSFLHVEDAARAVRCVRERAPQAGGIYNVGSPDEVSMAQLLALLFEVAGYRPRIEAHPAPAGSVKRRVPDIARLRALGFTPAIDLREGLRRLWGT